MPKVTIQDVAHEAGVALGTVSNVLNHPDRVRPATLERVRAAIDALGYAPNQSARLLAGGGSMTFGLVLPHLNSGFALQVANGAQHEAQRAGYDILIANASEDAALERRHLRNLAGSQVAGILLLPVNGDVGGAAVGGEIEPRGSVAAGSALGGAAVEPVRGGAHDLANGNVAAPERIAAAERAAATEHADGGTTESLRGIPGHPASTRVAEPARGGAPHPSGASATSPSPKSAPSDAGVDPFAWFLDATATAEDPLAGILDELPSLVGTIPLVSLGVESTAPGHFVSADNAGQGALVAEAAIHAGARHVAVVGLNRSREATARLRGIARVTQNNPDVRFEYIEEGLLARDGIKIAGCIAARPEEERPTFVIALTDSLATGLIAGFAAAGIQVPSQIAVAGCEGDPLAWTGSISQTTVVPSGYEVGRRGVQLLIEQIEVAKLAELTGEPAPADAEPENRQVTVHPFLLQRASTGLAPTGAGAAGDTPDLDIATQLS